MRAALLLIGLAVVSQVSAECANACSGNGVCRDSDQCDCFPNYNGADCSLRVCPYGLAWVDVPNGDLNHDGIRQADGAGSGQAAAFAPGKLNGQNGASGLTSTCTTYTVGCPVPIYTFDDTLSDATPANVITEYAWETYNPQAQKGEAHFYAECSNAGLCDRAQGLCVCFDGYEGSSCQRTVCPNDCSGNGVCRTVDEITAGALNNSVAAGSADFLTTFGGLNKFQTDNYGGAVFYSGVETATLYRLWDQNKAQACVCDPGYSGPDCSQRECPRGDDPLTHRYAECPFQPVAGSAGYSTVSPTVYGVTPCANEIQTIQISTHGAGVADWFHILYKDYTGKIWKTDDFLIGDATAVCTGANTLLPIATATGTRLVPGAVELAIKSALESIPNDVIPEVKVTVSTGTAVTTNPAVVSSFIVDVTFKANSGNLYALTIVNSAQDQVRLPQCISGDTTADFNFASVITEFDGNTEASTCSNRGVCDYTTGLCSCFKGYYSIDCSKQNALAQ